jgi:DNA-binding response OmpR family regulator
MTERILVVDDDAGIQEFLSIALEAEGYEVILAQDGKGALEWLDANTPDLIILDLMMPRMNGSDFVKALEQQGRRSALSLLLLTADAQAQAKASTLAVETYLSKPFDLQDLLDAITLALSKKSKGSIADE